MFDAIVVGATCGGAPTAMLLARKGYKVLLVDHVFPSDIPRTFHSSRWAPSSQTMGSARETCCHGLSGRHTRNFQLQRLQHDCGRALRKWCGMGLRSASLNPDPTADQAESKQAPSSWPHFSVRGLETESGTVKGIGAEMRKTGLQTTEPRYHYRSMVQLPPSLSRGRLTLFQLSLTDLHLFFVLGGCRNSGFEMHVKEGNAVFSFLPTMDFSRSLSRGRLISSEKFVPAWRTIFPRF